MVLSVLMVLWSLIPRDDADVMIKVDKSCPSKLKIMQVCHVLTCKMGQNFSKMYRTYLFGGEMLK